MIIQSGLFGIEIGGTKLQVVAASPDLVIRERRRFNVDLGRGAVGIRKQIEDAIMDLRKSWQPAAVGIGFGGPVNWQTGCICCSHHVEGWSEFPIANWVQTLAEAPVVVDNDANIAALGEALHGAGKSFNPVFYITLGSGVGGGLVVDGKIYHGAHPGEAEIGHVRLDKHGTIVEQRCSGWAVDEKIRLARKAGVKSLLLDLVGNTTGGEARHLSTALSKCDTLAQNILQETAEDIAFALSHVTHLFHPAVVVIGGGLSLLGAALQEAVAANLPRFVMEAFAPGPEIRLAALAEDAVPMGALVAAQRAVAITF
ncbi:MAG TPA: ROK family protein [Verrucomicrobiae bacterium]